MASRTWDGWTLPDEQAGPDDSAIPSRSNPITAVSACMPDSVNSVVFGSRGALAQKIVAFGIAPMPASIRVRSVSIRAQSAPCVAIVAATAAPKPAIPATFSVPARRLDRAGLVVGKHHRHQGRPLRQQHPEVVDVDDAVRRNPDASDPVVREPSPRQHRRVLDRGHQQPGQRRLVPDMQTGLQRERIGFRSAGGEKHLLAAGAEGVGDDAAGLFHHRPRRTALGVDRRRVADLIERAQHGLARLRPKRRRRIPVQVDPFHHLNRGF